MPFTFSHPAIVLPISRAKNHFVSVSALVIGSMTPDFEYFLKMKLSGRFSHTLPGAFLFCLPVAVITLLIFHRLVKQPFINSLPSYFHSRLIALRDFNLISSLRKNPLSYISCLLVGIFSHIFWDSFTHTNHFMSKYLSLLSSPITVSDLPRLPLFRYIQHGSSLLGAVYITYFFHLLPRVDVKNQISFRYWLSVILVGMVAYIIRASFEFEYLGDIVATVISCLFLSMILISIFFKVRSTPATAS